MTSTDLRSRLVSHLSILAGYFGLALAVTWPLARNFTSRVVGLIDFDIWHAIWNLWYVREALVGRVPWPRTTLLHFPYGVNLLVDGVGPVNAMLALPFWPWGPAAAFNGAELVGLTLSAWLMYLLARRLGLGQAAALFAGALFTIWPFHLAAAYGHIEKLFVGLLPLAVIAGLSAFDLQQRPTWRLAAPGVVLVLLLLQNGNQFVFGVLALAMLAAFQMVDAPAATRGRQIGRIALVGGVSLALSAPVLILILKGAYHPLIRVELGGLAAYFSPDVLHFVVPSSHQALARAFYPDPPSAIGTVQNALLPALSPSPYWYGSGVETALTIPVTAWILSLAACVGRDRLNARRWLFFAVFFAIFALGPFLRVNGWTYFTSAMIVVKLPYYYLQQVPGFDVMRTPGRFMMLASIGFSLAAAMGVERLLRFHGTWRAWAAGVVAALALLECWPAPWPQAALPPTPAFYRQLANDREHYGVLDLPAAWGPGGYLAASYALFQLTHRHPIAWAALSRSYSEYPIAGLSALWDPAQTDYVETRKRLASLGYRYVVWHKHPERLVNNYASPGESAAASPFLREAFRGEAPAHDDADVVVYRIDAIAGSN